MAEPKSSDLSGIWMGRDGSRARPTVYLRWLWTPNPHTSIRPDAEVPGRFSPLLALSPRMWAVRQLVQAAIARLAGRPACPPDDTSQE